MNGDGCFMMHGQELATAMQHGADIIAIVINNAMFGTIRMHQEREYPGRGLGHRAGKPGFRRARTRLRCPRGDRVPRPASSPRRSSVRSRPAGQA